MTLSRWSWRIPVAIVAATVVVFPAWAQIQSPPQPPASSEFAQPIPPTPAAPATPEAPLVGLTEALLGALEGSPEGLTALTAFFERTSGNPENVLALALALIVELTKASITDPLVRITAADRIYETASKTLQKGILSSQIVGLVVDSQNLIIRDRFKAAEAAIAAEVGKLVSTVVAEAGPSALQDLAEVPEPVADTGIRISAN